MLKAIAYFQIIARLTTHARFHFARSEKDLFIDFFLLSTSHKNKTTTQRFDSLCVVLITTKNFFQRK